MYMYTVPSSGHKLSGGKGLSVGSTGQDEWGMRLSLCFIGLDWRGKGQYWQGQALGLFVLGPDLRGKSGPDLFGLIFHFYLVIGLFGPGFLGFHHSRLWTLEAFGHMFNFVCVKSPSLWAWDLMLRCIRTFRVNIRFSKRMWCNCGTPPLECMNLECMIFALKEGL